MKLGINTAKYASTLVVGSIAAYQSYFHMRELIMQAGQDKFGAEWVLPLSVDGLALSATIGMIQAKREGRKPTLTTWVSLGAGVVMSLAANVASAWDGGPVARVIAGWPAIAVMLVIEMLARKGKKVAGPVDSSVLSNAEIAAQATTPRPRAPRARKAPATASVTSPSAPQAPTGPAPLSSGQKGWETRRKRQADAIAAATAALEAEANNELAGVLAGEHSDAPVSPAV